MTSLKTVLGFKSKFKDHALQPDEIAELANFVLVTEAVTGKKPHKDDLVAFWVERGGEVEDAS